MNKTLSRFINLAGVLFISIFAFSFVDAIAKRYNLKKYILYYVMLLVLGVTMVMVSEYEPVNIDEEEEYF